MKIPQLLIRRRCDEPKLTLYSDSGVSAEMTFADDASRDIASEMITTLYQENIRLQKELNYKDELLQTVLEDLDDACDDVVKLEDEIAGFRRALRI